MPKVLDLCLGVFCVKPIVVGEQRKNMPSNQKGKWEGGPSHQKKTNDRFYRHVFVYSHRRGRIASLSVCLCELVLLFTFSIVVQASDVSCCIQY